MKGTITWFSETKGYGFILSDEGGDYFFHESEVETKDHKFLADGRRVEFETSKGRKGRKDKAVEIKIIK